MGKECIPYGPDVSPGTFKCVDRDYKIKISQGIILLPPCKCLQKNYT